MQIGSSTTQASSGSRSGRILYNLNNTAEYEYYNGSDWIHVANDTLSHLTNDDKNLTFTFLIDEDTGLYEIQFRFDGDCRYNPVTQDGTLKVIIQSRITLSDNWNFIFGPYSAINAF